MQIIKTTMKEHGAGQLLSFWFFFRAIPEILSPQNL
jgi:hypothetical protein